MVIYKYPIPVKEKYVIDLPANANIIRVDDVEGLFYLWAIVDPEAPLVPRYLELYKTGQPITTPMRSLFYLGFFKLFIMQELCLYVFENLNPELCNDITENSQSKSELTK
jgi:hypothetical protein